MTPYTRYEAELLRRIWAWANALPPEQFDGGGREGRPPAFAKRFKPRNIAVPPRGREAAAIRAAIPGAKRHRHFGSLKSSQALTQSVFGALRAFGRLDLLCGVTAECGRPAFGSVPRGAALDFEHDVRALNEPRPTQVDVLLRGHRTRVAIERKFTEREFGLCSRPTRHPGHPSRCDGSYRVQAGRRARCALTEIGVRYWTYIPELFAWPNDRDHRPCPFGAVYQLARNALAAAVLPNGHVDASGGHLLLVYDARNPEFRAAGAAERQWTAATAACRVPGFLRRVTWQRLLAAIAPAPELAYLIAETDRKYALTPDPPQPPATPRPHIPGAAP